MAFDTSGFGLNLGQEQTLVPTLANLAPYAPDFRGLAWKPANIKAPELPTKGFADVLGEIGKGMSVAYKSAKDDKKEAQQTAMEERKFAFEQKKHEDTVAAADRREAKAVEERMRGVYTPMPGSASESQLPLDSMDQPAFTADAGGDAATPYNVGEVPSSEGNQYLKSIGRFEAPAEQTFSYKEQRGQAGKPSTTIVPPTPEAAKPSISIIPPTLSYVPPVSKPQDFTYNEAPYQDLQAGATQSLQDVAPYVSAGAGAGAGGVPSLPIGGGVAPQAPQTLYGLDLSGLKQQAEANVYAAPRPQQVAPRETGGTQGDQFAPPPRPSSDQIPKDQVFRSYEQARQEQAKDYGFYYEPMGEIKTFQDQNGPWYKVVRNPEKTSILEQKLGRLETARQRYDKFNLQQQNTIDREQAKFTMSPGVKAFTAPNGMQQSFGRFVKDYDAIAKNPEGSGISDIGLLDMFGRAEGGGRITEAQAALALQSAGIMDKPELLLQKLQGGARLTQNQRDQMLRVISEDHATQANIANQAVIMTRNKLMKQGITDEDSLPQPYIVPVTKWDFAEKVKAAETEATQLHLQRVQADTAGNKSVVKNIDDRLRQIQTELDPLVAMKRKSKGSAILNGHEIDTVPQGWVGGAVNVFQQQ